MEFLWSHGAVIQAGEFRHGPLEIVESGVPFLIFGAYRFLQSDYTEST